MRNESDRVFEALDEMLEGRPKTGVHVNISHLKLMGLEQLGQGGTAVGKNPRGTGGRTHRPPPTSIPYDASSTSLRALLPNGRTKAAPPLCSGG
jgi:N-acyl-D-amino-acid deacylase